MIFQQLKNNVWIDLSILLLISLAVKAFYLLTYGPIITPDSEGYIRLAEQILDPQINWRTDGQLDEVAKVTSSFRILGYPLLILVAKIIGGVNWTWGLVIAQMAFSVVGAVYLGKLAYAWTRGNRAITVLCVGGYLFGQGWVLEQSILTDSIHATLWVIVCSIIGLGILRGRQPGYAQVFGLGSLILAAFLLREADSVLHLLLYPFILYWAWSGGAKKLRVLALVMVFALPTILGIQAYKLWNLERTGHSFITTSGHTAMFLPALRLKERGTDPFANDPLLRDMPPLIEPLTSVPPLKNISLIDAYLHEQHAMNTYEISQHAYALYFRLWHMYPLQMVGMTLSNLRKKLAILSFMPFDAKNDLAAWATNDQRYINSYNIWGADEDFQNIATVTEWGLRTLSRIFAVILFAAFVFGGPALVVAMLVRHRGSLTALPPQTWLTALFWSAYMGYTFAYAMVSLEPRYVMPVQPFTTIIALVVLTKTSAWFHRPG